MLTLSRSRPYRVCFFSHEPNEPPHVHVDRDHCSAKVWLQPVALARSAGFGARALGEIARIVRANQLRLQEAWVGYFGDQRR